MTLPYIDMHCDTAFELYKKGEGLYDAKGQLSLNQAAAYEPYIQVFAIWTDFRVPYSKAYENFFLMKDNLEGQLAINGVPLIKYREELVTHRPVSAILAVEGADLLDGQLDRLEALYKAGTRILTLMWRDKNLSGGAWNTSSGLNSFGRDVVRQCGQLGIIVDVSHMSRQSFWDTAEISRAPFIASHSNSSAVFGHGRNLTDEQFRHIRDIGGLVGVNLCAHHVSDRPDLSDVIKHIEHWLSLGGGDTICIGCDLDGAEELPQGFEGIQDVRKIADALRENGTEDTLIHKLFYANAHKFLKQNLPINPRDAVGGVPYN
ncbi:MAG: dipeptidase [Eubacteriales bacterium]